MSKIFVSNIDRFRKCMSLSEIMFQLYGNLGRWVTNGATLVTGVSALAVEVTATGYLFQYFFNYNYAFGAAIGFAILTMYSTFGGIRAVAITDVFQFLVFFIGFPIGASFIYHDIGGYEAIINKLPQTHTALSYNIKDILLLFGYIFWSTMPVVNAPYIQRLLMTKNKEQLAKAYSALPLLTLFFSATIIVIGLSVLVKNPTLEPKLALYFLIDKYLPHIIKGIMISGMLAIIMSSADSILNAVSATIAHDMVKQLRPTMSKTCELNVAKISTVLLALSSGAVALYSKKIMDLIWFMDNFWWPIVFGLLCKMGG